MQIGAVGFLLPTDRFDQRTNLRSLGVRFRKKTSATATSVEYQSSSGVTQTVKLSGEPKGAFESIAAASAGVRFEFSRAGAVVFSAPKCVVEEIDDKRGLERQLRSIDTWDPKWIVITKVLHARSSTILVSGQAGSFVELKASADIAPSGVDLANLAAGFTRAKQANMSIALVSKGDLTPLYDAHVLVKPRFKKQKQLFIF